MREPGQAEIRNQLERWFAAGVNAVDPVAATRRALDRAPPPTSPPAVIAIGKAAAGMAQAMVEWLAAHHVSPATGVVVSHQPTPTLHPALRHACGDHPVPGPQSLRAAELLEEVIAELSPDTPVHVLVSGGTSALIGAPLPGIAPHELALAFEQLHAIGLDISTMNGLRQQLTRWSGGRLAAALGSRPVQAWLISDVIGNDLAVIGSGPLVATRVELQNVRRVLANPELTAALPHSVVSALAHPARIEPPRIPHHMVADARTAGEGVLSAARTDGILATLHRRPITGDAVAAGESLAAWIGAEVRRQRLPDRHDGVLVEPVPRVGVAHVWVSETTVALPPSPGHGGRAQQFALATARGIADLGWADAATVLVAGTDGRDGPTDAAGAIVNAGTLAQLQHHGIDVDAELERCNAHGPLDCVGALLRTGATGTNVADLVVVWMWNWY